MALVDVAGRIAGLGESLLRVALAAKRRRTDCAGLVSTSLHRPGSDPIPGHGLRFECPGGLPQEGVSWGGGALVGDTRQLSVLGGARRLKNTHLKPLASALAAEETAVDAPQFRMGGRAVVQPGAVVESVSAVCCPRQHVSGETRRDRDVRHFPWRRIRSACRCADVFPLRSGCVRGAA